MEIMTTQALVAPLDLEQALHLLDHMTWFPDEPTPAYWERTATYANENCPDSRPCSPEEYRAASERIIARIADHPATGDQGRWTLIVEPKRLYQFKYDLKIELYEEDWFTFMNMGYQPVDDSRAHADLSAQDARWRYAVQLYDHVASGAPLAGAAVAEVGCGRGGGASFVTRIHKPASYVGLDYSPANVAFCKRRHAVPGLSFLWGDAENLPFVDASLDAVINIESAHCYPDVGRFFAEVRRVLCPGGYLLFADEWWSDDLAVLQGHLERSGLELVRTEDITDEIIRALRCLRQDVPDMLAVVNDPVRRGVWDRFLRIRVCELSARSYTGGRFRFLSYVLRRPEDVPAG